MSPERYAELSKDPAWRAKRAATTRKWYREGGVHSEQAARNRKFYSKLWKKLFKSDRIKISLVGYLSLLVHQDHKCAICRTPFDDQVGNGERKIDPRCVDHDHDTGVIRGVLCPRCNLVLGHAKDDPNILRSAADYLEKSKC